jgi:hypothetical protein
MAERKKHYWYLKLEDIYAKMPEVKVRQFREAIVAALEKKVHYASIITKDGINRVTAGGHRPDDITDDEWIKVLDDNGEFDIEATATVIVKDMLITGAVIAMRYEDEMYDIVTEKDKDWITAILREK